ncbi:hypothetical protein FM107_19315 [Sphingobacterium sp. JB170]|nr:hypothetical protein FM107_19315 [Sphingobacterium sp. JB170]
MCLVGLSFGCSEQWLDVKKDQKLIVPSTIEDFQALLDNTTIFNMSDGYLGEVSSDDYFCQDDQLESATESQRRGYVWDKELVETYSNTNFNDWANNYQKIFYANVVLEGLNKMEAKKDVAAWRSCYGQALFWRSWGMFQLSQLFCIPYAPSGNSGVLGLPLPLEADINMLHERMGLDETYHQIKDDLTSSIDFLPPTSNVKTRPSALASFILLSRLCLITSEYAQALIYAESGLNINDRLLNYADLSSDEAYPFVTENLEVVLHTTMSYLPNGVLAEGRLRVDTVLYKMYNEADLRKDRFFKQIDDYHTFKGMYTGTLQFFAGLGMDELYLNFFEAALRVGKRDIIKKSLDYWLSSRYVEGYDLIWDNDGDILDFIMKERRKQLVFRGIRWFDIRRLNQNEGSEIILQRKIKGDLITLAANDPRYVFQIPTNVLSLNAKLIQNER